MSSVKCLNPWDAEGKRIFSVDGSMQTLFAGEGGHLRGVCYPINLMVATRGGKDDMRTCFGIGDQGDPQFTLSAAHEHGVCYAIEGNVVDRVSNKNGKGWCEDVSPTLNTQDRHAVVFALEGNGARPSHQGSGFNGSGKMYTLNTIEQHSVCYAVDCRNNVLNEEMSSTLQSKEQGGWSVNVTNPVLYENEKKD